MKTILNFIKKNRNIILLIISFVFLTMLILGMTYAYFDLKTGGETESTMTIGGAEISATYSFSNSINITEAIPSDDILSYKDITLTYKNTSSEEYKVYLKAVIDYSTFTNVENDGVLYYNIYSGTNHSTLVQNKTIFPTITSGKAILKEISIPANSNGTLNYRINFYFPKSDKLQNPDGQLVLNASISVESDNSLKYTPTLLKHIEKMYLSNAEVNSLEEDKTTDKNLRYVGASPRNYLKFNGDEIWRIVGVFNNITTIDENGKEKKESLVKIVRNDSLGDYSWDSSGSDKNDGLGVNEWSQADLMTELNTDYINQSPTGETTNWYNGQNNAKTGTYNYDKNIKSKSIDKIAKVRWNTSGTTSGASALDSYNQERSTTQISTPSDNVPRTNTWDGKIALIYPSDYGYASTNRACRDNMNSKTNDVSNCKNENWLFNSAYQWTLSPLSSLANIVLLVSAGGGVVNGSAGSAFGVRPALFLKSDIVIAGGTGESVENAYILK